MPFAGITAAGIGSAVAGGVASAAVGAGLSSLMAPGSGSGSGSGNGYYTPSGLYNADQDWQSLLAQQQGNQSAVNSISPYYGQSFDAGLAAQQQYGGFAQNGANAAGQQYTQLGSNLGAGSQQLLNAGQQVFNTAMDPQQALYNQQLQQTQDQAGATNSMYGLGSSAAGAGVANQATNNFNLNWQNAQLGRQESGLQAYGQAAGQAGQLGAAGAGYTNQGAQLPFTTAQGIAQYPGQLASQYTQGYEQGPLSSANAINSQIIPYLNYGQGAQSVPYQNAYNSSQASAGALASGLGSAAQNIGSYFGGGTGQSFSGSFGGVQSPSPYYSGGGGNTYGFTS
jgi:hypothetical protein